MEGNNASMKYYIPHIIYNSFNLDNSDQKKGTQCLNRNDSHKDEDTDAYLYLNSEKIIKEDNNFNNEIVAKLNACDNTLPGLILKMMRDKDPVCESDIITQVYPRYEDLRKPDGHKYGNDIKKAVTSTLCSSGIFMKIGENLWTYREKDAEDYVKRATERIITKNNEKKKKSNPNINGFILPKKEDKSLLLGKKK